MGSAKIIRAEFIDLDPPEARGTSVVVSFKGVRVPISRERLLELLSREEELLAVRLGRPGGQIAPAPTAEPVAPAGLADQGSGGSTIASLEQGISHGSLSGRIKRIYNYSAGMKELRPMHAGLLAELLEAFDWKLPEHPTTSLQTYLAEISKWRGVSEHLKTRIKRFLERYAKAIEEN